LIKHKWKYFTKSRENKKHCFKIGGESGRIRPYGTASMEFRDEQWIVPEIPRRQRKEYEIMEPKLFFKFTALHIEIEQT
jgi:hypothetical protein